MPSRGVPRGFLVGGEVNKNSNCRAGNSNYKYLVWRAKYFKGSIKGQPDTMKPLFSSHGL